MPIWSYLLLLLRLRNLIYGSLTPHSIYYFFLVSSLTLSFPFITRDTVDTDMSKCFAMSTNFTAILPIPLFEITFLQNDYIDK